MKGSVKSSKSIAFATIGLVFAPSILTADNIPSNMSVGYAVDPPFAQVATDGTISGAVVDIHNEVLTKLGVSEINSSLMEFGALIPSVISGRLDLSYWANVTPARCERVLYGPLIACSEEGFALRTEVASTVRTWEDIAAQNLRVGFELGAEPYTTLARNAGIPASNIVNFNGYIDGVALMMSGRVDVIPQFIEGLESIVGEFGDPDVIQIIQLEAMGNCAAPVFARDNEELAVAYTDAYNRLVELGRIDQIIDQYEIRASYEAVDNYSTELLCSR